MVFEEKLQLNQSTGDRDQSLLATFLHPAESWYMFVPSKPKQPPSRRNDSQLQALRPKKRSLTICKIRGKESRITPDTIGVHQVISESPVSPAQDEACPSTTAFQNSSEMSRDQCKVSEMRKSAPYKESIFIDGFRCRWPHVHNDPKLQAMFNPKVHNLHISHYRHTKWVHTILSLDEPLAKICKDQWHTRSWPQRFELAICYLCSFGNSKRWATACWHGGYLFLWHLDGLPWPRPYVNWLIVPSEACANRTTNRVLFRKCGRSLCVYFLEIVLLHELWNQGLYFQEQVQGNWDADGGAGGVGFPSTSGMENLASRLLLSKGIDFTGTQNDALSAWVILRAYMRCETACAVIRCNK